MIDLIPKALVSETQASTSSCRTDLPRSPEYPGRPPRAKAFLTTQAGMSRFPVRNPWSASTTLRTLALVHVRPVRTVHIPALDAFHLVGVLPMIGAADAAMPTAPLPVRIHVADADGLTTSTRPIPVASFLTHVRPATE